MSPARFRGECVALVAFVLGVVANRAVFRGLFINVDEIASFLQAQYFLTGVMAGELPAGWDADLPVFEPKIKTGYLARYARMVSSADKGAVFPR